MEGWDWPYYQFYQASFLAALKRMNPVPEIVIVFNDLVSPQFIRAAIPGVKTVVWLQNEQETHQKNVQKALDGINRFLTCSAYIRDYTVGRYNLPQERFSVVHSGVDLDAFSPAPDFLRLHRPLRTLFIGRIDPNKGPDIAADAVAALQREGVKISFTVAGGLWFYGHGKEMENPYFRSLKEKMDAAGAQYLGYVTRPNAPEVVRQHDVVFMLSRSKEPFGLVTLEAMASGCAVVSSNRGGLPEACGGAAVLVDPDDLSAVKDALRTLAADPEALSERKQKSIARAAHASWVSVGDRLHAVLSGMR
jgi:glycosyltransferase involved in cell wall biosynthesis